MNKFKYFLGAVASILQFGKNGGVLGWIDDHFEIRDAEETELVKLKIARGTAADDAVRLDQLQSVSDSGRGAVKTIVFCIGTAGATVDGLTNGMLKRGSIIKSVSINVGEAFDGVIPNDFALTMTDDDSTVIFDSSVFEADSVNVDQISNVGYILGDDLDINVNMPITGGTTGEALITIEYVEPVLYSLLSGSKLLFTPSRKIMHLDFEGEDGETTTIVMKDGTEIICGLVAGNFVFDINNVTGQTHTFTTVGEEYVFALDGEEYIIINETEEV